jgi:hypothetical protein
VESTFSRWTRRARLILAALTLAAGASILAAPNAHAATFNTDPSTTPGTVNCLSWQDQAAYPTACSGLTPTLSCVWDNGDGTYTAALGFTNPSTYTIEADAGSYLNSVYGNKSTPKDSGQPSFFRPGTSVTEFTVDWTQSKVGVMEWQLGDQMLTFSSSSGPACTQHPVPIFSNATLLGVTAFLGMCAFAVWNRRSLRRKAWIRALSRG